MQIDDEAPQRLSASLETLNARIARLAIGLDMNLGDQAVVTRLLDGPPASQLAAERRANREDALVLHPIVSEERRVAHLHEELRGLLVLRYRMETTSLNDNGLTLTRQIMDQAEEHLVHKGFKPIAHDLDLDP
jgi:hypothetical protein